jgi:AraC-like DNA-binding protein
VTSGAKSIDRTRQRGGLAATVSTRSVLPVLGHLAAAGLGTDSVLAAAGADVGAVQDPDARIPHEVALAVWEAAERASGDDALGLHVAARITPGAFDVLDYATRASATLGEGFGRLVRYHRVLHDAAVVRLRIDGERAELTHVLPGNALLPRHVAEFIVGAWLVVARQATGLDFAPVEATFRHPAPSVLDEHRRLFRSPVRFGTPQNALVVRRDVLDTPLVRSDPGLCTILERQMRTLLEHAPPHTDLGERVRALVAAALVDGEPRAASIARALHMSPRTLQRRLGNGGTSLREVVEAVRRDLAHRYLAERQIAIAEVAFLLGFSEASAFHRAFKRWSGTTPAEYRRALGP